MEEQTPGLDHLPLMVDSQPGFLANLVRGIAGQRALAGLATRDLDDPVIGLLDGAATMLDVLAFYGELIGNEGFIRTAREERAVADLARHIGYQPAPGVAATTLLAFDVEPPPGVSIEVTIPRGTQAQKVPGSDGKAAVFETSEELIARQQFNSLQVRTVAPFRPGFDDSVLNLEGIGLALNVGDMLLLVGAERQEFSGSEAWDVRRVTAVKEFPAPTGVDADPTPARTEVTLDHPLGSAFPHVDPASRGVRCFHLTTRAGLFGATAMRYEDLPVALRVGEPNPDPATKRKRPFLRGAYAGRSASWVDQPLPTGTTALWLDRIYPSFTPSSWVVLTRPGYSELYWVADTEEAHHNDFMQSGPATRLTIEGERTHFFTVRGTVVLGGCRELELGTSPLTEPLCGDDIVVEGTVDLEPGRLVLLSGITAATAQPVAEPLIVQSCEPAEVVAGSPGTRIVFETATTNTYAPTGVRVRANVVPATHGQTVREHPVGSGDAGRPFLNFALGIGDPGVGPMTYVPADNPSGRTSSLHVRVDGVLWTQVPYLFGHGPDSRVYVVRHGVSGGDTIEFGDGVTGARPGSGRDNVSASYRVGIGRAGTALPGQISIPLSLPLGVRTVTNPVSAAGGEDPETPAATRINAPSTVRTLDRIVSLQDYEDFARTFAGIGWATATELDDGERRFVHVTATVDDGSPLQLGSPLHDRLRRAMERERVHGRSLLLDGHRPLGVNITARVAIDSTYSREAVLPAALAKVQALFDKAPSLSGGRGFGQLLTPTQALHALQGTPGVVGAVLDVLRPTLTAGGPPVRVIQAAPAQLLPGSPPRRPVAAELLEPGTLSITEAIA